MTTDTDNAPETDETSAPASSDDSALAPAPEESARPLSSGAGAGTRAMGVERYVQFSYAFLGVVLFILLGKVVELVWRQYAEPSTLLVSLASAVLAVGISAGLYSHKKINELSMEVATELSKVTWPTRKETSAATVIVIVTSIIAAVVLGSLDFLWSAITDLIYTTKV